jgi:V/A-type H+-transporting ATPase subunit A
VDSYASPQKQFLLLDLVLSVYDAGAELIELGVPVEQLAELPAMARLRRAKEQYDSNQIEQLQAFQQEALSSFQTLRAEYTQREQQD